MFSLATLDIYGAPVAAVGVDKAFWPLSQSDDGFFATRPSVKDLLGDWPRAFAALTGFAAGCAAGRVPRQHAIDEDAAPLALAIQYPNKLIAIGANYSDHVAEMRGQQEAAPKPEHPVMFVKPASTAMVGPGKVIYPEGTSKFDWEIELAVVIGKRMRRVSREDAMAGVAGYSASIDFTARDLMRRPEFERFGCDFLLSKGQDTTNPFGPFIVPAPFIRDPHALGLQLSVNGVVKQDSNTRYMIHRIDEQISSISQFVTLEPGDVLITGTPSGVGVRRNEFLKAGDKVVAEIEGIGTLSVEIVAE
jgi:2-keto-4-pentenoate hydratase/2-oxohepta-3-ene-1,7-dioic acid hydratase in catechol pathway